jgi:DNA mismatch repair ATPase MutS
VSFPFLYVADSSLIAFAEAVDRFDLRRPVIKEQPVLKIRKGFHPLHAMCVPTGQYIDNDTVLEGGGDGDHSSMVSSTSVTTPI